MASPEWEPAVSIPVRVLGFLEPLSVVVRVVEECFNPCKGFGVFGTQGGREGI